MKVEISSNELFWYIKNGERVRQIRRVITHPSETCLDDREETIGILCTALAECQRERDIAINSYHEAFVAEEAYDNQASVISSLEGQLAECQRERDELKSLLDDGWRGSLDKFRVTNKALREGVNKLQQELVESFKENAQLRAQLEDYKDAHMIHRDQAELLRQQLAAQEPVMKACDEWFDSDTVQTVEDCTSLLYEAIKKRREV